jgi:hypothetical protein
MRFAHVEDARLQRHFATALAEVGAHDVFHLDRAQRSRRDRLLGVLVDYARRGRFPRNPDFAEQTPYFIDAAETRCAMAHLIESTGDRELVDRIANHRNNAFVRQLKGDAALRAWLAWAGLSADEASRIQPAYCSDTKADACICFDGPMTGVVEGVITGTTVDQYDLTRVVVRVDAVHGDTGMMVGGTLDVYPPLDYAIGDGVIITRYVREPDPAFSFGRILRVDGDHIDMTCKNYVPSVSKDLAVEALMAPSCPGYLAQHSSTEWLESKCDDTGCSAAGGAASPMIAMVAAALWRSRR